MGNPVKIAVWVGLAPWIVGVFIYTTIMSITGDDGLSVGFRDSLSPPIAFTPIIASLLFLLLSKMRNNAKFAQDSTLFAFVVAAGTGAGMIFVMTLLEVFYSGSQEPWSYVFWGCISLHLPMVITAAGVGAARLRSGAGQRDVCRLRPGLGRVH